MARRVARALLMAGMGIGACGWPAAPAAAQSPGPPGKQTQYGRGQLKMVVILSRHGVRSPTWTQARLDSYSALPWPKWAVAPGDLTSRGHELVRLFARYDRTALAQKGLLAPQGCADAPHTYIWADTDERTMETGRALTEGLFPGCAVEVHSLAAGESDPLFHPTAHGVGPAQADAAFAEFSARAKVAADPRQPALIEELQQVLLGCAPKSPCAPAHVPEMRLVEGAVAQGNPVRGKGDRVVDLDGPLAPASTLAEDLLLEYADGMAMQQVGWGHVDEDRLRSLLALHSDYFDLMHRTPAMAKLEASNMLSHIVRTLQQGVEQRPAAGALGPPGSKLVMLAGHDTNLAGVAALLGLHWDLDGRKDDTPPGTELAFELWQDASGSYSVRVTVAMQTLRQLREMTPLSLAAPPAHQDLTRQVCPASACSWDSFRQTADAATGPGGVY